MRNQVDALFFSLVLIALPAFAAEHAASIPPDEALDMLKLGNSRYVHAQSAAPKAAPARRHELASGQHPFAVVVGCSDSRVPPEMVFDQDLGDLFVVRCAGNVVSNFDVASIEYAIEHLGSRLVIVMGHSRCGAVDATIKSGEGEGHGKSHIPKLLGEIRPAVEAARKAGANSNLLDESIRKNVERVVAELKAEPALAGMVKNGKIKILGAYYDLDSGRVSLLD